MPRRKCLLFGPDCSNDGFAMEGASRCGAHRGKRKGPRRHDAHHAAMAKLVLSKARVCAVCGLPGTPDDPLEAGHIVALSQGGASTLSNYRAEHRSHNRSDGARLKGRGL